MPWLFPFPCHQQSWYWLWELVLAFSWEWISVSKNAAKCKCTFVFPKWNGTCMVKSELWLRKPTKIILPDGYKPHKPLYHHVWLGLVYRSSIFIGLYTKTKSLKLKDIRVLQSLYQPADLTQCSIDHKCPKIRISEDIHWDVFVISVSHLSNYMLNCESWVFKGTK